MRDDNDVRGALGELEIAIDRNENLMPYIIKAVKCYTTIGEISSIMRQKWGEFKSPTYI